MSLAGLALLLLVAGFAAILVGILLFALSALRGEEGSRVEGGAVLVVGPLPIVFGTSERVAKALLVLAIALTLITFAVFTVLNLLR
ncbi:MAG: DUF131 domain-containing protein [Thermofilum sp.]